MSAGFNIVFLRITHTLRSFQFFNYRDSTILRIILYIKMHLYENQNYIIDWKKKTCEQINVHRFIIFDC